MKSGRPPDRRNRRLIMQGNGSGNTKACLPINSRKLWKVILSSATYRRSGSNDCVIACSALIACRRNVRTAFLQQLPPDRRRMVGTAIRDLRAMPPEQRQEVIESERFKSMFSPQERDLLTNASRLPLAPAESQNEQGPEE